ncbi:AGCS family alanine or glycine:cation symporter [Bacillus ectoiniformans]|uniref:alanine/glycine:cation symporter family protein n=1 Tax=Bacillus ectoiniformans TaxID=1494429 RepID=UPI00195D9A40|nr:sodium:alanine symporter family protein [Bacillus ectoiniformans]MBM7650418.1 AGCS family alanine or glycine:cation symporter [Bacillus ectoiniformans]
MDKFEQWIGSITGWVWGLPMILLLLGGGLFLTVRIGFFQFRYFPHIMKETFGKIFTKDDAPGSVTPFQATTAALASTIGAANIVGVPVAIALGGPGAIFWMWLVAMIGMGSKYAEVVLGVKYRTKNEAGEWTGGPMHYIEKGLGWKPVATFFAFFLMIEIIASTMVQSNSLSTTVESAFDIPPMATGVIVLILVALVTLGGIKRIGAVTEKFIPLMVGIYLVSAIIVLIVNVAEIPAAFGLIFYHAFTPISAAGGFAGAGVAAAIRWGLARGIYSNEAGMGTAPIAHAAAKTDHPAKQGLWGIFEVIVDTLVVCTMTALVVLTSGAWKDVPADEASSMVVTAMSDVMGSGIAGTLISIALFFFVLSTVVVIVFYGEKQAEYLFGLKFAMVMRFVYLAAILVGAIGGLQFIWQFLDLMLAMIILPNVIALLFLSGEVRELTKDYISKYIKKDTPINKDQTHPM